MIQERSFVQIQPPGASFQGGLSDLYFAYGSNMNHEQIHARCNRPKVISPARLADYRLAFYGYSEAWDGAFETVEPMPGSEAWGVLFFLSKLDWERLDL